MAFDGAVIDLLPRFRLPEVSPSRHLTPRSASALEIGLRRVRAFRSRASLSHALVRQCNDADQGRE